MNTADQQGMTTARPTPFEAEQALDRTQRMFRHALSCWASDVLRLRALGLIEASWTAADCGHDGISRAA
jgi:hypothetical protein